jgi:hypothetical protein
MAGASTALEALLLMIVGIVIVSGYTSINAIVKAELFPSEIRALGVGMPYGLTVALFGGTVNYIALWLRSIHLESAFSGMYPVQYLFRCWSTRSYLSQDP